VVEMDCKKEEQINKHETEIALIKQYSTMFDREITNLRKQSRANAVFLISNLILIIIALFQKFF
jgi:hypothetical protein